MTSCRTLLYGNGCGTDEDMLEAYVGIISHRGLEVLFRENPRTMRLLWNRSLRTRRRTACIWTVLPKHVGGKIHDAIRCGSPSTAMRYLCESSREMGRLVSLNDDPTEIRAERLPK